jgi:hypothetical protein
MSDDAALQAIRHRMRDVRQEMRGEVDHFVSSARTMTDWRYYVRTYPWACGAAAAVFGYYVVWRMRPVHSGEAALESKLETIAELAKVDSTNGKPSGGNKVVSSVAKAITSAALRAALGYLGHRMTNQSWSQQENASFLGGIDD